MPEATDITISLENHPVKAAFTQRDLKLVAARTAYSAAVAEANQELANVLRRETRDTPVMKVAEIAEVSRQTIHDIMRRFPAKT